MKVNCSKVKAFTLGKSTVTQGVRFCHHILSQASSAFEIAAWLARCCAPAPSSPCSNQQISGKASWAGEETHQLAAFHLFASAFRYCGTTPGQSYKRYKQVLQIKRGIWYAALNPASFIRSVVSSKGNGSDLTNHNTQKHTVAYNIFPFANVAKDVKVTNSI